jgi:hypothetical protein
MERLECRICMVINYLNGHYSKPVPSYLLSKSFSTLVNSWPHGEKMGPNFLSSPHHYFMSVH